MDVSEVVHMLRLVSKDLAEHGCAYVALMKNTNKQLGHLGVMPAASVARFFDLDGKVPEPPKLAYRQVWQGYQIGFTADEVIMFEALCPRCGLNTGPHLEFMENKECKE